MSEPAPGGEAWDKVATILRRSVPRQQFETWFRGMRLISTRILARTFSRSVQSIVTLFRTACTSSCAIARFVVIGGRGTGRRTRCMPPTAAAATGGLWY